ncbi:MAG: class I SAM-dependent methyltransferase [Roseivivax sp.]|nr:class I SAM-dependent methyltransferase [Roseivivax sp.]
MSNGRVTFALDTGALTLPDEGIIAIFGASAEMDLSALDPARLHVIQPFRPDHDALTARGLRCGLAPEGPYAAAIVCVPRARDLAQAWIAAAAAACPGGLLIVDGAKTDGVDTLLKAMRQRTPIAGQVSKAHGRVFWLTAGTDFADWAARRRDVGDGLVTAPGVFSADGPDAGSRALAQALPANLGGAVADLGAGWGYLSAQILKRPDVTALWLVEADANALDCARSNISGPRADFVWADATRWDAPQRLDAVVMNPPFHTGRAGDPDLGRAFIQTAARNLKPAGRLWMVANRHLPYEAALAAAFRTVTELPGTPGFKLLMAEQPTRPRRR